MGRLGDEVVSGLTLRPGSGNTVLEVAVDQWSDRSVRVQIAVSQTGQVMADSPQMGGEEMIILTPGLDPAVVAALKGYLAQLIFEPVRNGAGQLINTNARVTVTIARAP